jgi:hypothetical protein
MRRVVKLRSVKRYYVDRIIGCDIGGGGALAGDFIVIRDVKDFSKESYLKDRKDQLGYVYDLNNGSVSISEKRRLLMNEDAPFGWEEYVYGYGYQRPGKREIASILQHDDKFKIPMHYIAAVALGFYDDDNNLGLVVNHKNWRKEDNRPDNLELCTLEQQKCHEATKLILEKYGLFEPWMALNAFIAYNIVMSAKGNKDLFVNEVMRAIYAYPKIGMVYTPIPRYEVMPIDFGKDFEEAFQGANRKNWNYRPRMI